MARRRFALVSDDEEEEPRRRRGSPEGERRKRGKKAVRFDEEEEEAAAAAAGATEGNQGAEEKKESGKRSKKRVSRGGGRGGKSGEAEREDEGEDEEEEEEEEPQEEAKPIGDVIRVSGKGKGRKYHFQSFEYDGNVFELEDPVLLTPEAEVKTKPYVAIIKDITQNVKGSVYITGQWFYRPEEAEKKGGGHWDARDTRELFYSFHLDPVPAESVMHKCVVHFIPLHKKLPLRSQHPGFIVQKVYDTVHKRLWKLTDKDYEDNKQHEIDLLVQKTRDHIGELPDVEPEECTPEQDDESLNKQNPKKRPIQPIDVSRTDEITTRPNQHPKAETPGSCRSDASECKSILSKFKALTGDSYRDRWLDKLLHGIKVACNLRENTKPEDKKSEDAGNLEKMHGNKESETSAATQASGSNDGESSYWPEAAIQAITALEKAAHESLGSDFQKYNQKMRQLDFNLKSNGILARRLLNKELIPNVILSMSPNELKDGLTADERANKEPEETKKLQMTDARCSRCSEKTVGIAEIIQTGGRGDRYQLECISCGHNWYASQDAVSSLTIEAPNAAGNVGTAPWATAKFDAVEKTLASPRESEKPSVDVLQKSTAAYMPVLETQKSFNRTKPDDQ